MHHDHGKSPHWGRAMRAGRVATTKWSNHFCINDPPVAVPLFAYHSRSSVIPLTRAKFLKVLDRAILAAGLAPLKGHGIRIGATLEYLLRKIPFDVVKVKGRWAGDSF